jgi:hypothetical protein
LHVNLLLYFYILPCGYYYLHCVFFRDSSIEELQDPDSSPRREEVGRRTLGDTEASYSRFLSGEVSRVNEHYSKTSS